MAKAHIAIATDDLEASIEDYTLKLNSPPCLKIEGQYALWRIEGLNLSVRFDPEHKGEIRHIGLENENERTFHSAIDHLGITWEFFSSHQQKAEIKKHWPDADCSQFHQTDSQGYKHRDQLKLLSVFYYILGALGFVFSLFPIFHLILGIAMVTGEIPEAKEEPPIPQFFGWMFVLFPSMFILMGFTLSSLTLLAGSYINKRKRYLFIFIMACIHCLFMPFGTVLGVFTIILLSKEEVKDLFNKN